MRHDQPVGLYQRLVVTHRTIVAAALLVGACGTALADELRTPAELQFENSRNAAAANYGKCLSQSKKADYANCDGLRDVYASHFPDEIADHATGCFEEGEVGEARQVDRTCDDFTWLLANGSLAE